MQKELLKKQIELLEAQSASTAIHDQTKVPAAMRTSVLFGDVLFDDDVKRTKELERKKWLLELEAQKKEKLMEKEYNREKDKLNDLKKDLEIKQQNYYEVISPFLPFFSFLFFNLKNRMKQVIVLKRNQLFPNNSQNSSQINKNHFKEV